MPNKIFARIKKIFLEVLPAFIFFFIMFHILAVTRALALKQYGINVHVTASSIIGALIVAKVVLIADRLPFLNLYPKKPLVYTVVIKTIVFSLVTLLFLILEEWIRFARVDGSFAAGWRHLSIDTKWSAIWARQIWLFVLILFYCAARELARVIGEKKVGEIFFGTGQSVSKK
jgi:hypothetical protein